MDTYRISQYDIDELAARLEKVGLTQRDKIVLSLILTAAAKTLREAHASPTELKGPIVFGEQPRLTKTTVETTTAGSQTPAPPSIAEQFKGALATFNDPVGTPARVSQFDVLLPDLNGPPTRCEDPVPDQAGDASR